MRYEFWTPDEKGRYEELQNDREQASYEYELADEIVKAAMAMIEEPDLRTLKNAMYLAHCFLNEELEELPGKADELGLDVWIENQRKDEADEKQEPLDQDE